MSSHALTILSYNYIFSCTCSLSAFYFVLYPLIFSILPLLFCFLIFCSIYFFLCILSLWYVPCRAQCNSPGQIQSNNQNACSGQQGTGSAQCAGAMFDNLALLTTDVNNRVLGGQSSASDITNLLPSVLPFSAPVAASRGFRVASDGTVTTPTGASVAAAIPNINSFNQFTDFNSMFRNMNLSQTLISGGLISDLMATTQQTYDTVGPIERFRTSNADLASQIQGASTSGRQTVESQEAAQQYLANLAETVNAMARTTSTLGITTPNMPVNTPVFAPGTSMLSSLSRIGSYFE